MVTGAASFDTRIFIWMMWRRFSITGTETKSVWIWDRCLLLPGKVFLFKLEKCMQSYKCPYNYCIMPLLRWNVTHVQDTTPHTPTTVTVMVIRGSAVRYVNLRLLCLLFVGAAFTRELVGFGCVLWASKYSRPI